MLLGSIAAACSGSGHVVGADNAAITGSMASSVTSVDFSTVVPAPEDASGVATSCTAFALPTDASGAPACDLLSVALSSTCDCSAAGLATASADDLAQARVQAQISGLCADRAACMNVCACLILPATGASLDQCTSPAPDSSATGWCYVSEEQSTDASTLVASSCALHEQHEIRFFAPSVPTGAAALVVACSGGQLPPSTHQAALGETCVSYDETLPSFSGYDADEVVLDNHAASCRSAICLQNHFQGRASCPYGQATANGSCLVAGSDVPVDGPVKPQLVDRRADVASICSCQCGGSGPGPYCTCGAGMECAELIDDIPGGQNDLAGSYCIPAGSEYAKSQTDTCTAGECGDSHPF